MYSRVNRKRNTKLQKAKLLNSRFVDRNVVEKITNEIKINMEVRKVTEGLNKSNDKLKSQKKPAIQYDRLGLPRITGRGARIAHKKWLEENGYERD